MKRILVVSDMHCGHRAGLTHPVWHFVDDPEDSERYKWAVLQRKLWMWFSQTISEIKDEHPIDYLFVNGDSIDGKGERAGGTEIVAMDRKEQARMASMILKFIGANDGRMTYGTPYHTGVTEDMEDDVADDLGYPIEGHGKYDVEGVKIDMRHFVSSSIIPHGRFTALSRDTLWRGLWQDRYKGTKPDILIRSHVHYFGYCGTPDYLAMTTPALQGLGSKFGGRVCSGIVDFGMVVIDCDNGEYTWRPITCLLQAESQAYETL